MAISTIGNITYINQNMQTTSTQHANATQRSDFIPQEFEDKLKEIEEVRPTEQNQKVDKDSKNKQEFEQESKKNPKQNPAQEQNTESSDNGDSSAYLLNIKV